jgi:TM2 domain-containing membrane protein YozV
MNAFFLTIIILAILFIGIIWSSMIISEKFPNSRITLFIKKHIMDSYNGDDF